MSKIGLILAQNNEINFLPDCLSPWIEFRKTNPLLIVALDVCFDENGVGNSTDGSLELLTEYQEDGKIDYFQPLWAGLKEHEARNVALKWLLDQGVDLIISVGSDEIFKESEIKQIFDYVNKDKFTAVFKIHYKNYINDKSHYVLGFKPNRIWRVKYNNFKISEFFWDDDVKYLGKNSSVMDKDLPSKVIPNVIVDHFSWLDCERSRKKIEYQSNHFSPPIGLGCSYKWENGKVVFDAEFYKKTCQPVPEIHEC